MYFSLWMLKNFILFKTHSLQSALHIVVVTYLEVLAGHKIKDCRLVVTWVEMLSALASPCKHLDLFFKATVSQRKSTSNFGR